MAELRWGVATDPGLVRDANEDAFVAEPLVFVVADGMGGHRAGEVASELASTILRDRLGSGARNVDVVVAAVLEANAAIFQAAHSNIAQRGMGTTVTALVVLDTEAGADDVEDGDETESAPERLALVNVGDSRTYLHRDGQLTRATVDHSYVQELVATGHITEAEARTHPRRNIVTRGLGIEPTVRVDAWVLPAVTGDRYILCSDGLVDEVPDHEIADVAGGIADPQRAADELVAMANRHGGRDNVTVIVVDVIAATGARDATGEAIVAPVVADEDETAILVEGDVAHDDGPSSPARGADDETVEMDAALVEAPPTRRRLTTRLFLTLLAAAAVLTLAITLIAVAVSDDDSPPPVTTTDTTDTSVATTDSADTTDSTDSVDTTDAPGTTRPPTTRPSTTLAPSTTTVAAATTAP